MSDFVNQELKYMFLNTADISGNINPAELTSVLGIPNGGYSNSVGSIDSRNAVQTFNRVNLRRILGEEWALKYKTFGIRLVLLDWSYHKQTYGNASARFLRIRMEGLPWINRYSIGTKTKRSDAVILGCTPFNMTIPTGTYTLGYGDVAFPSLEFQLMDDSDEYDLKITWKTNAEDAYPTFTGSAGLSYAFPTTGYMFQIWPITHRKPIIVRTHGFPLPKNKHPRIENYHSDEEDNEE